MSEASCTQCQWAGHCPEGERTRMTQTPTSHSGAETDLLSDMDSSFLRGERASDRRLQVQIVEGPDLALVREVTSTHFTVGTSRKNELVLADPTVSRHHLRVDCSNGILVQDLDSRNGIFFFVFLFCVVMEFLGVLLCLGF